MTARPDADQAGIVTRRATRPVAETVSAVLDQLRVRQIKVFAVIDQRAEARRCGLDLRETTLAIFGNPRAGTKVMAAAPLAALDLPLRILVWADGEDTNVSYFAPEVIASRHRLTDDLLAPLAAIEALVDALVEHG